MEQDLIKRDFEGIQLYCKKKLNIDITDDNLILYLGMTALSLSHGGNTYRIIVEDNKYVLEHLNKRHNSSCKESYHRESEKYRYAVILDFIASHNSASQRTNNGKNSYSRKIEKAYVEIEKSRLHNEQYKEQEKNKRKAERAEKRKNMKRQNDYRDHIASFDYG